MPRNPGVSNVRATAPRSISGGVALLLLALSVALLESTSMLSQRIPHSLEPAFDERKHVFGRG